MLFLEFAQSRLDKSPTAIALSDMTPDLITAFLNHLEQQRHNCVRSRNARLAALRSFLKFAARRDVSSLQVIEHALCVPVKRFERPMFGYLSREDARLYRKRIKKAGHDGITIQCNGKIFGGKKLGLFSNTNFGVWLDLPIEKL